jgi:hypothetical protein
MKVKRCMRQGCQLYVVEAVNEGKGPSLSVAHLGYYFLCSWWRVGSYISHHENEIAQRSTSCNDNIVPY